MFSLGRKKQTKEKPIARYLPLVGHLEDDIVLLDDGSVFAMFAAEGIAWETADVDELIRRHDDYNMALRNISSDTLILSTYQCRGMAHPSVYPPGVFRSKFAAQVDEKYRAGLFNDALYVNPLYIGVTIRPARYAGEVIGEQVARRSRTAEDAPEDRVIKLNNICDLLRAKMADYGLRRLGITARGHGLFTEIGEALVFALTAVWRPIGLSTGKMGNALFSERVIVGREAIDFVGPGRNMYAAMFGIKEYPESTYPGMFGKLSVAPYLSTLFQSYRFVNKNAGIKIMGRKQNRMGAAQDKAFRQRKDLDDAANDLASNLFILGDHTLSVIAFAETMEALLDVSTAAWRDLADGGLVAAREGAALEAAFASMVPGNDRYRPRPGYVSSRNFAAMAPLHNYPAGPEQGRWGPPIALLRTQAGTPFRFHWHPDGSDVGNTLITGETGSGKSLTAGFFLAMTAGRARVIALDFKRGWELLFKAMDGDYAVLGSGRPHLAPLKALSKTPRDIEFLNDLIRGCIRRDLTPEEDRRLALALSIVMSRPRKDRWMADVRAFLGPDPNGAGALLENWCWGNELGWALDAPADTISLEGELHGLDTTALIENARVRGPSLAYIFYRIELELDGRPILIPNDEGWRALLDDSFRPMIERRLRTIRSYGGVFVFITQGPSEIKKSDIGSVLVEQCPTRIALPNPRARREDYQEVLKMTDGEWEAFHGLRKGSGQFLLSQGNQSLVAQLWLPDMEEEVAILSAREETLRRQDAEEEALAA